MSTPLDRLSERLGEAMRGWDPAQSAADLRRNADALIRSCLSQADLVTREELDVQEALLRRTREKLDLLERRVAELEAAGKEPPAD